MENVTLKIDPKTGDLSIGEEGIMETVAGIDTTAQNIRMALKAWKNDFPLLPRHGTNWNGILGQAVSRQDVEEEIRESVYQETDVTMVTQIDVMQKGRELSVSLKAATEGEELEMEVTV